MTTNAQMFASRGNPWVSPREGREKFGRNVEAENPEIDALLFADRATKQGPPQVVKSKPVEKKDDPHRRRAAVAIKLRLALNGG